jgi:hypothetical protein
MPYGQDYAGSARRHFAAANDLNDSDNHSKKRGNKAVAGYLFGLTGELALKQMMSESGMRPLSAKQRQNDPFYAHFPYLKSRLRDVASGRRSGELLTHARNDRLFEHWNTDMRYAPTTEVTPDWVSSWKTQAKSLVDAINL